MIVIVPQTSESITRVVVKLPCGDVVTHDAVTPFPSPFEIELPEGTDEDQVEVICGGVLANGELEAATVG